MTTVDVLVSGASGNTGHPIVEELLARGASVRAMVRSPGAAPEKAATVVADFDDVSSVRAALDGVRRAYLVTPSSERAEQQQVAFVDAARDAGVERRVVLSQLGARADSPVHHGRPGRHRPPGHPVRAVRGRVRPPLRAPVMPGQPHPNPGRTQRAGLTPRS